MEESIVLKKESPFNSASIFSRFSYLWVLQCTQNVREGNVEDIHRCPQSFLSKTNGIPIEEKWTEEIQRAEKRSVKPSLLKVIMSTYRFDIIKFGVLAFINFVIIKGSQPIVLSKLIQLFMDKDYTLRDMFIYGGGTCALLFIQSFLYHQLTCGNMLLAYRVRAAVSSLVYRKILKLSQKSLSKSSPGQILNTLSNDVARIDGFLSYHFLWILPIQVSVIVVMIWVQYGPEALGGVLAAIVLIIPSQGYLGRLTGYYCKLTSQKTDIRMKMMNEIYSGMEVIKMYTWETPFEKNLHEARAEELKYITFSSHIKGLMGSIKFIFERIGLCISVLCYSFLGHPVMANMVFSLSVIFRMLQFSFAIMLPLAMTQGSELLVSLVRLEEFLLLEEYQEMNSEVINDSMGDIQLVKVGASYGKDINIMFPSMNIPRGTLCAVVGPVGSGKSSFLKLILGELPGTHGTVTRHGTISFSSQTPWLFPSTIRKNIVFNQDFDEIHYRNVIRVCGLTEDLRQLPHGDRTVVGSRGITLSGGQKARINLARAVYKKADMYLLDDVLSALDSRVGRYVFEECIVEFLRGKTRVFVTHQLQYMKEADQIIIFNQGVSVFQGSFDEFSTDNTKFADLFPTVENDGDVEVKTTLKKNQMSLKERSQDELDSSTLQFEKKCATPLGEKNCYEKDVGKTEKLKVKLKNRQCSAFWFYVKSSDNILYALSFALNILLGQFFLTLSDYWITFWSEQELIKQYANESYSSKEEGHLMTEGFTLEQVLNNSIIRTWVDYVNVGNDQHITLKMSVLRVFFIAIVLTLMVVIVFKSFLLIHICVGASRNIHNKIFRSLLGAPKQFFSQYPPGYTMNIFSKDLDTVDEGIPKSLMNTFGILPVIVGALFLIFISNYYMIVILLPVIWMAMKILNWYIVSYLAFRRMEAKEKSPIFTYVGSTIDGIDTIRATKSEKSLMAQFDGYQDIHTSAGFLATSCTGAFGLWSDLLCVFLVCFLLLAFIIMDSYIHVSGSFKGLAIFQAISLVGPFQFVMKTLSEALNHLTSVERILDYTKLDREEEAAATDSIDLSAWPSKGRIKIQNLYVKYGKNDEPVLQNLNLEILPSEKIGIAGRTGAGKSSIISALFRLTPFEGTILIDGVDTNRITLKSLREKISIIPQEPMLFSGTIRYNLDPLNEFTDEEIWMTLEEVELKETIESLNFELKQGGNNFSVGQKQLICLARALLRKNKIVVLDEATANVDSRTDELIQKTIRRKFKNCTVLTVAHRLSSIVDSDRILVMDSGRIIEFDTPAILLQNPDGHFRKLLEETTLSVTENRDQGYEE